MKTNIINGSEVSRLSVAIHSSRQSCLLQTVILGNDSDLLIVFYVQIMPDDLVIQLHRF